MTTLEQTHSMIRGQSIEGREYYFTVNIRFSDVDKPTLRLRLAGSGDQLEDEAALATLKVTFASRNDFKSIHVKRVETTETQLSWP